MIYIAHTHLLACFTANNVVCITAPTPHTWCQVNQRKQTMQTALEPAELWAIEAAAEELAAMPTRDLIDRAMSAPGCDTLTVALVDRLESYIEELDSMEDALRAAGLLPRKQPGKVVDLRSRQSVR